MEPGTLDELYMVYHDMLEQSKAREARLREQLAELQAKVIKETGDD